MTIVMNSRGGRSCSISSTFKVAVSELTDGMMMSSVTGNVMTIV